MTQSVKGTNSNSDGRELNATEIARRVRGMLLKVSAKTTNPSAYKAWRGSLPLLSSTLGEMRNLCRSPTPKFGLLLSTPIPTIAIGRNGAFPIATEIRGITSDEMENPETLARQFTKRRIVATFHTHATDLSLLPHDEKLFGNLDHQLGTRLHVIGSSKGFQFYLSNGSPRGKTLKEEVSLKNGK